jgi:hypothetical protein
MMDGASTVGGISKLTIEPYSDPACTKKTGEDPLVVLINPETYKQKWGILYTENLAAGSHGEKVAEREKPGSLTLALVFDGTGAVPGMGRKSVSEQIADLRRIGMTLKKRRTNYLALSWGTLRFKCRLQSLDVTYTLFNPDGTPLRAKVSATFESSHVTAGKASQAALAADHGAYLTVGAGDDLAAMCKEVYGDSSYVLDVAAANGLDSFRKLDGADMLYFPPLEDLPR